MLLIFLLSRAEDGAVFCLPRYRPKKQQQASQDQPGCTLCKTLRHIHSLQSTLIPNRDVFFFSSITILYCVRGHIWPAMYYARAQLVHQSYSLEAFWMKRDLVRLPLGGLVQGHLQSIHNLMQTKVKPG
jgi:hypothetical protein